MVETMNGSCYRNMIDYGVRNLHKYCKVVNQLNVFPVPDGDTGTNMVITIQKGLGSVDTFQENLSEVSRKLAVSIVFGARGNSGVIVSQFIKGISEVFFDAVSADAALLVKALEHGVECAHEAVAEPVEGTILTVIREATEAVMTKLTPQTTIDDVISQFITYAKISLEHTPELLPALKEAGVVDSGGAGIVYFFEGIRMYLDGESLEDVELEEQTQNVDYSVFNPDSSFEFGYCTEFMIQLLNGCKQFRAEAFKQELGALGNSIVVSTDNDKVRVHIHTLKPEAVLSHCHQYGEFLTLKIENMTVQHTETVKNILCAPTKSTGAFSVVAVAYDPAMQKLFAQMGADVVILCEDCATTKDYMDAFEKVTTREILVFPNNSDSILTAMQAKKLCKDVAVTVLHSRSIAECYASLPIIDFEETDTKVVVDGITETINNMYVVSVARRKEPENAELRQIHRDEFYAFSGKEIVAIGKTLEATVIQTIEKAMKKCPRDVITIFRGKNVRQEQVDTIIDTVNSRGICAELFSVDSPNNLSELTISFE